MANFVFSEAEEEVFAESYDDGEDQGYQRKKTSQNQAEKTENKTKCMVRRSDLIWILFVSDTRISNESLC